MALEIHAFTATLIDIYTGTVELTWHVDDQTALTAIRSAEHDWFTVEGSTGHTTVTITGSVEFELNRSNLATQSVTATAHVDYTPPTTVPGPDDASWSTATERHVHFANSSPMPLFLDWIDFDGVAREVTALPPGHSSAQSSFVHHLWRVRDQRSGEEVGRWRLTSVSERCTFTGMQLFSTPRQTRDYFGTVNRLQETIRVCHVDAHGNETFLDPLDPGEQLIVNHALGTVFRAYRQGSGRTYSELVGLHLHNQIGTMFVGLAGLVGEHSVTLTLHNQTPLELSLSWVDHHGEEYPYESVPFHGTLQLASGLNQTWRVRDADSGVLLGGVQVDEEDTEVTLHPSSLRPDVLAEKHRITFYNRTPLDLDLYWIDDDHEERFATTLRPEASSRWWSRERRLWIVRDAGRQRPVGMYVCTARNSKTHSFRFHWVSGGSDHALTFINDSLLTVQLQTVTGRRTLNTWQTLAPGEQEVFTSKTGRAWLVRDTASGQIIDFLFDQGEVTTISIDDRDLTPAASEVEVQATFTNHLPFEVDLVRIAEGGEEVHEGRVGAGDSKSVTGYATHPWRARLTHSGLEVATVLLTADATQSHDIRLRSSQPDEDDLQSSLSVVNDSPLNLGVYWMDPEGEPRLFKVLPRGETFETATWPGHFWLLRDRASGAWVGLTRGLAQPQRFDFTGESLRSAGSGDAVDMTVINLCNASIEVYRVTGKGKAKNRRTLAEGQQATLSTKQGQVWFARTVDDQRLTGLFIKGPAPTPLWVVQSTRTRPAPPVFTASFTKGRTSVLLHGARACFLAGPGRRLSPMQWATPEREHVVVDSPTVELRGMMPRLMLTCPDAACSPDGKVLYVFQGDQVAAYDMEARAPVAGWALPKPRSEVLPDLPFDDIDCAAVSASGGIWLLAGEECVHWRPDTGALDPPQSVSSALACRQRPRWDTVLTTARGRIFFVGDRMELPGTDRSPQPFRGSISANLRGLTANNRPHPRLRADEVQLYQEENYGGAAIITRGDVPSLSESGLSSARSARPATGLGLIAYNHEGYAGMDDILYRPAPQLEISSTTTGAELGEASTKHIREIESFTLFEVMSEEDSGVHWRSVLGEDYDEDGNAFPTYRASITVPETTETVQLWSTERQSVMVGTAWRELEPLIPVELTPNVRHQLQVVLRAHAMGVPALQLRTDRMPSDARVTVFPDEDLHTQIAALGDDDIWNARSSGALTSPLRPGVTQADSRSMTQALRQVSAAALRLTGAGRSRVRGSDHPSYDAWALDLSAIGTDRATFTPISDAAARTVLQSARALDAQVGQGIWGKIGNAITGAGEALFESGQDLWDGGVNLIEQGAKITVGFAEGVGDAATGDLSSLSQLAGDMGDMVSDVGDAVLDVAEQMLEVAIEVGGQVVKVVLDSIKKIGEFLELLVTQFVALLHAFLDWLLSLFPWTDILETQAVLKDMVEDGLDALPGAAAELIDALDGIVGQTKEKLPAVLSGLARFADARSPDEGDDPLAGMDTLEWLLDKLSAVLPDVNLPTVSGGAAVDTLAAVLATQRAVVGDALTGILEAFDPLIAAIEQAVETPADAVALLVGGMIEALTAVADRALDLGKTVFEAILAAVDDCIDGVKRLLKDDFAGYIPVISDLFHGVLGIKLNALNVFTLVGACAVTPALGGPLKASAVQGDGAQTREIIYIVTRCLQSALCAFGSAFPVLSWMDGSWGTPLFLGAVVAQGTGFLAVQGVDHAIWQLQQGMLILDVLRIYGGTFWGTNMDWHAANTLAAAVLCVPHIVLVLVDMGLDMPGDSDMSRLGHVVTCLLGPILQDVISMAQSTGDAWIVLNHVFEQPKIAGLLKNSARIGYAANGISFGSEALCLAVT